MSISRPIARLRRIAASAGGLGLAGVLALSGAVGGGAELTDAAWNDTEVAQASVKASWVDRGFARVNHVSWQLHKQGASGNPNSGARFEFTKAVSEVSSPSTFIQNSGDSQSIVPDRTTSNDIWLGQWTNHLPARPALVDYCIDFPTPSVPTAKSTCGGALPASRIAASQTVSNASLSIMGELDRRARINIGGATTKVRCFGDGTTPTAVATLTTKFSTARETSTASESYGTETPISTSAIVDSISNANDGYLQNSTGQKLWHRANIGYTTGQDSKRAFVLFISPRKNTYVSPTADYARAEIDLEIQVYSSSLPFFPPYNLGGTYRGSINYVISRSECGTGTAGQAPPPQAATFYGGTNQPSWTPPLFSEPLSDADAGTFLPADPVAVPARLATAPDLTDQTNAVEGLLTIPPTTTVTSPLENSTASETTTSAPPNPSEEDEAPTAGTTTAATTSTPRRTTTVTSAVPTVSAAPTNTTTPPATKTVTTTSAAPAVVIPDDPGTLSPTARLEDVGTVTVGGEDFVVVVEGTTVPTDAPQGVAALEIWLGGGDPGDTWATFTSTDPAADGWRWAAINQETGTVVYVR